MFFKKRKDHFLLGMLLGTVAGMAGAAALMATNREFRKTAGREMTKFCRRNRGLAELQNLCK